MPGHRADDELDTLFQLPLDQFTQARNTLAKQAGAGGAEIRALAKPPLAAWAVNQLYWQDRSTYTALVTAAEELRKAHKAVLGGRAADIRSAGRGHDQALDAALRATMGILTGAGHPASDSTRQAIVSTLRALPSGEAPGRLTRTLQPGGFEMLAGLPVARGARIAAAPATSPAPASPPTEARKSASGKTKAEKAREAKALARAKETAGAAFQALQRAEHEAKREEFERARAARDGEKAAAAVTRAREALEQARQELEGAERAAKAAEANRERAEKRAIEADRKATAAREKAAAARAALAELER
jgi:hypothetical protein